MWTPDHNFIEVDSTEYKYFQLHKAKEYEPEFVLDDHFKEILAALNLFFWRDPEFETKGYGSLKKGLFITGNVGVGKTLLMRLFIVNPTAILKIISTNRVADVYQECGIDRLLDEYARPHNPGHICFDDLGAERIGVKHMGNEINVMEQIILTRYDIKKHCLTHFTSNLDANQIEAMYGTRVRSRLREMVNFFEFGGTDRRK